MFESGARAKMSGKPRRHTDDRVSGTRERKPSGNKCCLFWAIRGGQQNTADAHASNGSLDLSGNSPGCRASAVSSIRFSLGVRPSEFARLAGQDARERRSSPAGGRKKCLQRIKSKRRSSKGRVARFLFQLAGHPAQHHQLVTYSGSKQRCQTSCCGTTFQMKS